MTEEFKRLMLYIGRKEPSLIFGDGLFWQEFAIKRIQLKTGRMEKCCLKRTIQCFL